MFLFGIHTRNTAIRFLKSRLQKLPESMRKVKQLECFFLGKFIMNKNQKGS